MNCLLTCSCTNYNRALSPELLSSFNLQGQCEAQSRRLSRLIRVVGKRGLSSRLLAYYFFDTKITRNLEVSVSHIGERLVCADLTARAMDTPELHSEAGDRQPAFKLLVSCPSGLDPSKVSVVFDKAYDRVPHPDITLESSISQIWDGRVQQNPSFFNGLKFRYRGHTLIGNAHPSQKADVCLHLGLTDYRTFVGTNLNPLWERFLCPSEDDSIRCQHTANPLGNGAIVETSDKEIVVLQRSANVGEFPGHFVFPGGHPEPEEVGIKSHDIDGESTNQIINQKVSQEMFDSIIREVVEEIGVPATTLDEPVFIGVSQRILNVRPTAFFFIKCSLQSKEIQQLYGSAQDGYESTHIYTMSIDNLAAIASKMPGCHQGGFALYKLMVDAATSN